MAPEEKVKAQVKAMLSLARVARAGRDPDAGPINGWYYMPVQAGMGVAGIPDFIGCIRGHMFAIETKADAHKKPTPLQSRNLAGIEAGGGTALVIHSGNLDGLQAWIEGRLG